MRVRLDWLAGTVLCVVAACHGADPVEEARQALAGGEYARAAEIAGTHIQGGATDDRRVLWALERIRLEGLARSKQGDQAADSLALLASRYPAQVDASLYLTTGEWAREAGRPRRRQPGRSPRRSGSGSSRATRSRRRGPCRRRAPCDSSWWRGSARHAGRVRGVSRGGAPCPEAPGPGVDHPRPSRGRRRRPSRTRSPRERPRSGPSPRRR